MACSAPKILVTPDWLNSDWLGKGFCDGQDLSMGNCMHIGEPCCQQGNVVLLRLCCCVFMYIWNLYVCKVDPRYDMLHCNINSSDVVRSWIPKFSSAFKNAIHNYQFLFLGIDSQRRHYNEFTLYIMCTVSFTACVNVLCLDRRWISISFSVPDFKLWLRPAGCSSAVGYHGGISSNEV